MPKHAKIELSRSSPRPELVDLNEQDWRMIVESLELPVDMKPTST
jgi:uncharacterized protein (DUF1778 family)